MPRRTIPTPMPTPPSASVNPPATKTKLRMRKQLLEAAARLLKNGHRPSIDDVAREAMVSRATVYRYFPSVEAMLAEAPVDHAVADPAALFAGDPSLDPVARLEKAESMLHEVCYQNERSLRVMLAASVQRNLDAHVRDVPLRQSRRTGLIDAALDPVRSSLPRASYERLRAALSLVFGTESMIVFSDVLGLDEKAAREVKRWMIQVLVSAEITAASSATTRTASKSSSKTAIGAASMGASRARKP